VLSLLQRKRELWGEPEHFLCDDGCKSFCLDWSFDLWRCDAWHAPMCSVWDFYHRTNSKIRQYIPASAGAEEVGTESKDLIAEL